MTTQDLIHHLKAGGKITPRIINKIVMSLEMLIILEASNTTMRRRLEAFEEKHKSGIYLTNEEALLINAAMIELDEFQAAKRNAEEDARREPEMKLRGASEINNNMEA